MIPVKLHAVLDATQLEDLIAVNVPKVQTCSEHLLVSIMKRSQISRCQTTRSCWRRTSALRSPFGGIPTPRGVTAKRFTWRLTPLLVSSTSDPMDKGWTCPSTSSLPNPAVGWRIPVTTAMAHQLYQIHLDNSISINFVCKEAENRMLSHRWMCIRICL